MRVTVIGAGVAGLCVATELQRRGVDVAVIGTPPGPDACSWWAGGMLAPDCEGESAEEPVVRLGREAAEWWQARGVRVHRRGTLVVSPQRDAAALARFARRSSGHREVDVTDLEPALPQRRGLFFADEAHLTPREALAVLAAGVEFTRQAQGQVIDCRGLVARDVLPDLRGVRGETVLIRCPDVTISRPVRLLHPRMPLYLVPRGGGVYLLGATSVESDGRGPPTVRAVLELLSAAFALHPALAEAEVLELGADARPAFPDNLPRIRRVGGALHVNGLYRHGFLLAPAMARIVADHLLLGIGSEVME